jgi:hypothetical protein
MITKNFTLMICPLAIFLFVSNMGNAQFYPTGGYQGGLYGNGGNQTFEFFNPPGNLVAVGGDSEVFLNWDAPFPIGEVKYDDSGAEMWYWLNYPSSDNDYFYVRFNSPFDGYLTDVAVLNSASSSANWQDIRVCPDDGSGKPNLAGAWNIFPSVAVTSLPQEGGEWEVLTLPSAQPVSAGTTFYVVTHWTAGSNTGPFVGTDTGSNSGRSAWSVNGGTTWNSWTQNFIMRAFITTEPVAGIQLNSAPKIPAGALPVMAISSGETDFPKYNKIAASLYYPPLVKQGKSVIGLSEYKIYRSVTASGPYSIIDSVTGTFFTDVNAANNTEYFYVVTAQYQKGESGYSNESAALPQSAASLTYQNTFDMNNGGFYPKGEWEWGVPAYAGGPPAAYSPPNLWGTNLDGTYSNFTNSWLIQPFDVHFSSTCSISFATWYLTQSSKDFCYVAIDHDYDNIYDRLATYSGSSSGWQMKQIVIPDSLKSAYARLAFILFSDHVTTYAGFYIDNLTIESYVELDLKVWLEGPYEGSQMTTTLNSAGLLLLSQPFNSNPSAPWYYTGTESVGSIPNANITDWILIELRQTAGGASTATSATMIARQAGFILKNGLIKGLDGSANPRIPAGIDQNLYLVVWHRNHLGIMSANGVTQSGGIYAFDFSTAAGQVYGGTSGYNEISTGTWGMITGDGNPNGLIDDPDDMIYGSLAGTKGYKQADYNLDTQVENKDKNDWWVPNIGKGSQVPE